MDHAHRGEAALASGKPEEAIEHYTHAIKESPSACAYYVKRSTAYQRTSRYQEAYADADVAVLIATKRAKRELMGQAQLRRAIALFHLERYGDSEFALALAKKYDEKEKTIGIWEAKLKTKLQGLDEGSEKRKVTIKEKPNGDVPDANGSAKIVSATHVPIPSPPASATKQEPPSLSTAAQTPANKIRHDWYQNNDSVIVSLMVKGAPKDHTAVEIKDTSVSSSKMTHKTNAVNIIQPGINHLPTRIRLILRLLSGSTPLIRRPKHIHLQDPLHKGRTHPQEIHARPEMVHPGRHPHTTHHHHHHHGRTSTLCSRLPNLVPHRAQELGQNRKQLRQAQSAVRAKELPALGYQHQSDV